MGGSLGSKFSSKGSKFSSKGLGFCFGNYVSFLYTNMCPRGKLVKQGARFSLSASPSRSFSLYSGRCSLLFSS